MLKLFVVDQFYTLQKKCYEKQNLLNNGNKALTNNLSNQIGFLKKANSLSKTHN